MLPTHGSAALGLAPPAAMSQQLRLELPFFPTISWVERTDSTNSDLLHQAHSSQGTGQLMRPWLLGAHAQNKGRGRGGRTWENKHGANLMFSCAFDVFLPTRQLPTLSPLAGVVVAEALRELLPIHAAHHLSMKWPNDILWHDAKLAGILTEVTRAGTSALSHDHHVVIIGIGINLQDARALSQSLNRTIADWAEIVSAEPQLNSISAIDLVACIAKAWYQALNDVTAYGFKNLPFRYKKTDGLLDKHLSITHNNKVILTGIGAGINAEGQLLVRQGTQTQAVSIGEVSVRNFNANHSS